MSRSPSRRRFLQTAGIVTVAACTPKGAQSPAAAPSTTRGIRYRADGPVVMLGAHCDDIPLECWRVLATTRPRVVIAFMAVPPEGTKGTDDKQGPVDASAFTRTRQAEEREVLGRLGLEPTFLSGLDMPYRKDEVPNLGPLAAELAAVVPEASVIVAPLGLGIRVRVATPTYSHVDHKLARDLADSFPAIPKVYFGEVYALSKTAPNYDELYAQLQLYPHWRVDKITLTAVERRAKEQAFRSYRTQVGPLLSAVPDFLEPGVIGTEILCDPSGGAALDYLAELAARSRVSAI